MIVVAVNSQVPQSFLPEVLQLDGGFVLIFLESDLSDSGFNKDADLLTLFFRCPGIPDDIADKLQSIGFASHVDAGSLARGGIVFDGISLPSIPVTETWGRR